MRLLDPEGRDAEGFSAQAGQRGNSKLQKRPKTGGEGCRLSKGKGSFWKRWTPSPREEQEKTSTRKRRKMRISGQEGTGNPEHANKSKGI